MKLTRTQASILAGASTVLAIFPQPMVTRYAREITPLYTPCTSSLDALRGDWVSIGKDIHQVLSRQGDVQARVNLSSKETNG